MACCGGNAIALTQASAALDMMLGVMGMDEAGPPADPNQPVRLEFVGDEWGEQVWFSPDRQRQYRAGRDPSARYIDAAPGDVAWLLSIGKFVRVQLPAHAVRDEEPALVADAPPATPRQRGRRV